MFSGCPVLGRIWAAPLRWVISRSGCRKACYSAGGIRCHDTSLPKKKHFAGVPLFELVSLPYRSHFIQQPAVFTTSNFYQCHRVDSRVVGRRRHYHMVLEHRIKRHGGVSPTPLPQPSTQTLVRVHARPSHISSLSPRILRQYFSLSTISYPPRNTRARPAKLLSR